MAVESAADRAAFVNADEFGAQATYTPAGGAGVTISGILIEPSERVLGEPGLSMSEAPEFTVRSADLPTGARGGEHGGDQLAIPGSSPGTDRRFRVRLIEPDGTGMSRLTLTELS